MDIQSEKDAFLSTLNRIKIYGKDETNLIISDYKMAV